MSDVCAVVLAAGEGRRLRPLTEQRPKALCPVGNVPLLDLALSRVDVPVAVNASYLADQVVAHVGDRFRRGAAGASGRRVHVSLEPDRPLGTSGALGKLRDWIAGRDVLVVNADAYLSPAPPSLLEGWDGKTVRLLGVPTTPDDPYRFGPYKFAGMSLLPWVRVAQLEPQPAELVRTVWRPAEADGALEVVPYSGTFLDTGTPRDYLAANLHAAADGNLLHRDATVTGRCERAVVGAGAVVRGDLTRAVVWPGGRVAAGEHLVDAIRAGGGLTVRIGR